MPDAVRALVLEPSRLFRDMLSEELARAGAECVCVGDLAEARAWLARQDPDLIVAAMQLPDGDGLSFIRELRRENRLSARPMLLLTSDPQLSRTALGAGVTEVFERTDFAALTTWISEFVHDNRDGLRLGGRALLVEDSASVAALIGAVLGEMGLTVDCEASVEAALQRFATASYDIVVTDVVLEGARSGLALVRAIRHASGVRRRVPVLAISSLEDPARRVELLRSGANDFVSKPLVREELQVRVRNLVMNKQLLDTVEAQQEHLQRLAMTDQLTSLYNRHYMAEVALERIVGNGELAHPLSLLLLDLDHFKGINDTHGHGVGDMVLAETGMVLRSLAGAEDIAARLGGEEFVLLLPSCGEACARQRAEELRLAIAGRLPAGIRVTASIGIATLEQGGGNLFDRLYSSADEALYRAKEQGRNRVVSAGMV